MFVYSLQSHRKIAHFPHCKIIRRIAKKNRCTFSSLEEMQKCGYHLCNCCSPMAQKYRKEKKALNTFCKNHQLQLTLLNDVIHIISRHDCWRILIKGSPKKFFLYHKNTENRIGKQRTPSIVPGFHSQPFHADSILKYLVYIAEHDMFRDDHPHIPFKKKTTFTQPYIPTPQRVLDKYGEPWSSPKNYQRIKGTKKYRKQEKRKKQRKRIAQIIRVNALIDELAAMNQSFT